MRANRWLYVIVPLLAAVLTGCGDSSRVVEEVIMLPESGWPRSQTLEFEFEIKDTTKAYNLVYNIRNDLDYPFSNMYIQNSLEDSLGNQLASNLQEVYLFHKTSGRPSGESTYIFGKSLGSIYDHSFYTLERCRFRQSGTYMLKVRQYMRDSDPLPSVLAFGLRVELAE